VTTHQQRDAVVEQLLAEHDRGRQLLRQTTGVLSHATPGEAGTRAATCAAVAELLAYLETELEIHIAKEEGPLFSRLKAMLPANDSLVAGMVAERDLIRMKRDDLRTVLLELQSGHDEIRLSRDDLRMELERSLRTSAPLTPLAQATATIASKLGVHFANEEELVFPLVPRLLSQAEQAAIAREMQAIQSHTEQEEGTNVEAQEPAYIREHGPLETPLRVFHFESEVAGMKHESSWSRGDRIAKTLVKESGLTVVLTVMKADTQLQPHRAAGALTIQCLSGHIQFSALERRIELGPGEMAALDGGIEHSVEAAEESAFLLTIVTDSSARGLDHAGAAEQ